MDGAGCAAGPDPARRLHAAGGKMRAVDSIQPSLRLSSPPRRWRRRPWGACGVLARDAHTDLIRTAAKYIIRIRTNQSSSHGQPNHGGCHDLPCRDHQLCPSCLLRKSHCGRRAAFFNKKRFVGRDRRAAFMLAALAVCGPAPHSHRKPVGEFMRARATSASRPLDLAGGWDSVHDRAQPPAGHPALRRRLAVR